MYLVQTLILNAHNIRSIDIHLTRTRMAEEKTTLAKGDHIDVPGVKIFKVSGNGTLSFKGKGSCNVFEPGGNVLKKRLAGDSDQTYTVEVEAGDECVVMAGSVSLG